MVSPKTLEIINLKKNFFSAIEFTPKKIIEWQIKNKSMKHRTHTSSSHLLSNGQIFDDRYRLISYIGKGSSVHAYLAENLIRSPESDGSNKLVALKIFREEEGFDLVSFEQIFLDFLLRQAIDEPHVISYMAYGIFALCVFSCRLSA